MSVSESSRSSMKLPPEQEAIRAKCFHRSGTFVQFPREEIEQSIPERFEKIVRLHRARIDVRSVEQSGKPIARAILTRRGQGSEPIALLFEHGIEVVATIIGVLKAGKFYVAMDIDSPRERVTRVLRDSGVHLIVTDSRDRTLTQSIAMPSTVMARQVLEDGPSGRRLSPLDLYRHTALSVPERARSR